MKKILKIHKISVKTTFLKYLLSYLTIFTVLLLGFFFIIRKQLVTRFFEKYCGQVQAELEGITQQINDNFVFLSQIDASIRQNGVLSAYRYQSGITEHYQAMQELNVYDISSPLIESIVYAKKDSENVLSTSMTVEYRENVFYIINGKRQTAVFDPAPYLGMSHGQMIAISNDEVSYWIYFPATGFKVNYIFFYILDLESVDQQLKNYISEEVSSIVLVDESKEIFLGENPSQAVPYLENMELKNGIYKIDPEVSICVKSGTYGNFSMIAVISNYIISGQINRAFASSYLILLLLSVLGLFLVYMAMKYTYLPLRRLVKEIKPDAAAHENYLDQLSGTFLEMKARNQLLKDTLDDYRTFMQKSLMLSIVDLQQLKNVNFYSEIDQLFNPKYKKNIFVVYMASCDGVFSHGSVLKKIQGKLLDGDFCIMMKSDSSSAVFIINCSEMEEKRAGMIKELLNECYRERKLLSAVSSISNSPLDIPSLYEEAMYASGYWTAMPAVSYSSLPGGDTAKKFHYPYQELDRLSEALRESCFRAAREQLDAIFGIIDRTSAEKSNIPDFFICCVLLEALTAVTNSMSQSEIKWDDLQELYFETLDLCRNGALAEIRLKIYGNLKKMLDFYEETSARSINAVQLRKVLEEFCCQPDFSITVLADRFEVSISYMSSAFKNVMGQNFSDYLWEMRLEKAKELLTATNMTISEIGISVGYFNDTSFRRKFKQETGVTPSAYRAEHQKGTPSGS